MKYKIISVFLIMMNCLTVYVACYFYYQYTFTVKLFYIMFPTSTLIVNFVCGIIGIGSGLLIFKKSNDNPLKYLVMGLVVTLISMYFWFLA